MINLHALFTAGLTKKDGAWMAMTFTSVTLVKVAAAIRVVFFGPNYGMRGRITDVRNGKTVVVTDLDKKLATAAKNGWTIHRCTKCDTPISNPDHELCWKCFKSQNVQAPVANQVDAEEAALIDELIA